MTRLYDPRRGRLHPGQNVALDFPVVGETEPSPNIKDWKLIITGAIEGDSFAVSLDQLKELASETRVLDTVCVTGWTHFDHRWTGVPLDTLLRLARPLPEARFIRFEAYSSRRHDTSLDLAWAEKEVLLAYQLDGGDLSTIHGGPVRTVCGGKYFYKSVKWIHQIELMVEDKLGFWERESGYHNNADLHSSNGVYRLMPLDEFERRVRSRDFSNAAVTFHEDFWKRLRKNDCSGFSFRGAKTKRCDLTRIDMRRASCQGANFTLTKFCIAKLNDADLSDCDLEGADFQSADLSGADLRGNTALTCTTFRGFERGGEVKGGAILNGTRFTAKTLSQLTAEQREYVTAQQNGAIIEE